MKYKKNSTLDILLRMLAVKFGIVKGRQLVSVFSKTLMIDLDTPGISKAIYTENYREIDHTNIYSEKLKNKKKILDLGANIGYYMLQSINDSPKNSEVICIEPDPRNLNLLYENIEHNNVEDRVKVLPGAVTGDVGKVLIEVNKASNLNRIIDHHQSLENSLEVDSFSLDSLYKKFGIFDCIRMDVEGAESAILSKNSSIFLENMPINSNIFMEIHPLSYVGGDNAIEDALEKLSVCGFSKFEIVTSGCKQDKKITEKNYSSPVNIYKDGKFKRYHHTNVSLNDAKYFVTQKPKIIRYLIVEK